jgi:hypothetical protein
MDNYRRELDLMFQEMNDAEMLARKNEIVSKLESGTSRDAVNSLHRDLCKIAARKGKTKAQRERWADDVLRRLQALIDQSS